MRLLELRANKPTFHTITFNRSGLSIILGKRHVKNNEQEDRRNTYNSVGKSLSVALIHFCLGSNPNPEYEEKLKDWEFYLDFELGGNKHTSHRSCSNQKVINLDGKEYNLAQFRTHLESKVFNLPQPVKFLTFRSLISRFIRPSKPSYSSYHNFVPKEQEYTSLICNSFLLGLSHELIEKKHDLKDKIDEVEERKKAIEKDSIMKSFFAEDDDDDIDINIVDISQKVEILQSRLNTFQVAEDYYEIVKEADKLKKDIKNLENNAAKYRLAIRNINESLEIQPEVSSKKIQKLYEEAKIVLPDNLLHRLDQVQDFNKKLIENRSKRLLSEKNDFLNELRSIESNIDYLGRAKDQKLSYLSSKGALDEFTKLNDQLRDYVIRLEKLQRFKSLMNQYKNKLEELNKDFSDENIKTNKYLENNTELLTQNLITFKALANQFYSKKKAGIEVKNNDGKNKIRFNLKAKIDDDKGVFA